MRTINRYIVTLAIDLLYKYADTICTPKQLINGCYEDNYCSYYDEQEQCYMITINDLDNYIKDTFNIDLELRNY